MKIYGNIYPARVLTPKYDTTAKQSGNSFADALSSSSSQQKNGIYHTQSLKGQKLPLTEAPDYSAWTKEDAYCDIIERYNLLNILTSEQASEIGLSDAYEQMKSEINNCLYGGNPFEMCSSGAEIMALDNDIPQRMNRKVYSEMYGITSDDEYQRLLKQDIMSMYDSDNFNIGTNGNQSDAFAIWSKLSDFDLTDQKTNLTRTVSGMLRGDNDIQRQASGKSISVSEYLNHRELYTLLQYRYGTMSDSAYDSGMDWNNFVRELYNQ